MGISESNEYSGNSICVMCEKSVNHYLSLFHSTGSVAPKQHNGGPSKTLNDFEQFTVLQTLIHNPTAYLHEVQDHLFQATGIWVSASTICCTIKEQGFTHKKVEVITLRRSEQRIYGRDVAIQSRYVLMKLGQIG